MIKRPFIFTLGCTIFLIIVLLPFVKKDLVKGSSKLISPQTGDKILGINLWFPKSTPQKQTGEIQITAKSAIFIETKSGKVLFSKNSENRLPIASLVKIMTVLIALDNKSIDDEFIVSDRASKFEPDKMFLIPGEKFSLKELLYGIFLISANDAAEVLAENSLGSRNEFINQMNERSLQLGMKDTQFVNPTGLDEDSGLSYSTAYDLVLLTRHLIKKYPEVIDISKTEHVYFERTSQRQDYDMYSGINLLTTYPGVIGFKTGYTPQAGYTLVTLARKGEFEVIGVLLESEARREEAKSILDYAFKQLGV